MTSCLDFKCGNHGVAGDIFDEARHCRKCFGAARSAASAKSLGRQVLFAPSSPPSPQQSSRSRKKFCVYLEEPNGTKVDCATCHMKTGENGLQVFSCSHPELSGECTIADRPVSTMEREVEFCGDCDYRADELPGNLPIKMVLPRDHRPHVWRNGILQIWTTRACDRSCFGCTQGSNLAGKPEFITPDQFRVAVDSLKDYFGVVGVFGGNPCIHPQFDELCSILRGAIAWEQRGLWSNHPKGRGRTAAVTFNPAYSNLNVHESKEAWDEFSRDWPECRPYLKGLAGDSRHAPPFVAMKDVIADEAERWKLIETCDVNRNWSAMICVFRGQLRGYFCEIAASQAMLHQDEPDYPDLGVPIVPGWWQQGSAAFDHQVRKHCHECGVPLRGHGATANSGPSEQVSETHRGIYNPKRPGRVVELVTDLVQLGSPLKRVTDYIENGAR